MVNREMNEELETCFEIPKVIYTKKKPLISQGLLNLSGWCRTANWWRWWESNPRPKNLASETLHRYSVARFNHLPAQRTRQSDGDPVEFRIALRALRFPIR